MKNKRMEKTNFYILKQVLAFVFVSLVHYLIVFVRNLHFDAEMKKKEPSLQQNDGNFMTSIIIAVANKKNATISMDSIDRSVGHINPNITFKP